MVLVCFSDICLSCYIQIGLLNLENEDFVKKIVEQTHTSFQVSDSARSSGLGIFISCAFWIPAQSLLFKLLLCPQPHSSENSILLSPSNQSLDCFKVRGDKETLSVRHLFFFFSNSMPLVCPQTLDRFRLVPFQRGLPSPILNSLGDYVVGRQTLD